MTICDEDPTWLAENPEAQGNPDKCVNNIAGLSGFQHRRQIEVEKNQRAQLCINSQHDDIETRSSDG